MKIDPAELAYQVRTVDHQWIAVRDGTRLSARLFLPVTTDPVPAVLESMPYRKDDLSRKRDDEMYLYLAGHGIACVRLDVRGTGDSEGLLEDEYLPVEQDDCEDVLAWMRAQSWCDGSLGVMGLSWSGFSALQTAARRPEGLKAVIAVGATDDRYGADIHYSGGVQLVENPLWDATFLPMCALPPNADIVGEAWQEMWRARLQARGPWLAKWLSNRVRNSYWKQGSISEDWSQIECAVYTVSGYSDGYVDPVYRMAENLTCPRKALVGPWGHAMPHEAWPGPRIGFLQEIVRWWDYWLKGVENGIMNEPAVRIFLKEAHQPEAFVDAYEGSWIEAAAWPPADLETLQFHLTDKGLKQGGGALTIKRVPETLVAGQRSGKWGAGGGQNDLPVDQSDDDARSLCFDTEPLKETLDLVGQAQVYLQVSSSQQFGHVVVRLCEVSPEGVSTRLSWGVLNLAHRGNFDIEEAVPVDVPLDATIDMKAMGHRLPKGHRLRLTVSSSYWPIVWPDARPFQIKVHGGDLALPVWQGNPGRQSPFADPVKAATSGYTSVRHSNMKQEQCFEGGRFQVSSDTDYGQSRIEVFDIETGISRKEVLRIDEGDSASAALSVLSQYLYRKGEDDVRIVMDYKVANGVSGLESSVTLDVALNGEPFFQNAWHDMLD